MKLLDLMAEYDNICPHIHLPLQAGSDRILQLMNRTYSQKEYLLLVAEIKKRMPDITLTTDIIVGFPSETEAEYRDTLHVMREVEFDAAFMFKYSRRPHTIAGRKYPDDVPEEEKTARMTRLVNLQRRIARKKNRRELGKTVTVLVEGRARKETQLMGRTPGNKIVVFPDEGQQAGQFVRVKIEEVTTHTFIGRSIR